MLQSLSDWLKKQPAAPAKRVLQLADLEDRVLFSVAPASAGDVLPENPLAEDVSSPDVDAGTLFASTDAATEFPSDAPNSIDDNSDGDDADGFDDSQSSILSDLDAQPTEVVRRELVIIDSNVDDHEGLLESLGLLENGGRSLDVIVLDPDQNGIEQITAALADRRDIDAVHVLTHGTDGAIKLGQDWLHAGNLGGYAGEIARWHESLTAEADILFYGCDLAASERGQTLLDAIGVLTGADVAASTDGTGSEQFGADWILEYHTGAIETDVVISPATQHSYEGLLSTFTVTNTNDSGAGSLRQAIEDANSLGGLDTITFSISGAGAHTITTTSALPTITEAVLIDGWSEPDFAGTPVIVLNGNDLAADGLFLSSTADGSTIRGLVIRDFDGDGIEIAGGSDNNTIVGNYIGSLTAAGADAGSGEANSGNGLHILGANNTIGGTTAGTANVLSGNANNGISIIGAAATGNVVQGNLIGTNAAGTAAIPNGVDGILIDDNAANNTIGGTTAAARNVISGNVDDGVELDSAASGNVVSGNYIGTDITGTADLGNQSDGVLINVGALNNTIGGTTAGEGNTIAFNDGIGVNALNGAGTGNSILGNSIHTNGGLGIDLNDDGVTANDAGDGDTGPNNLQNYPVLTSAQSDDFSSVTLDGTFNGAASATIRIEFFASSAADGSGFGEGQRYLGFTSVTTDGSGNASFSETLATTIAAGEVISATATRSSTGDTSEFSASINVHGIVVTPTSGLVTTEGGATANFSVVLNAAPTADVTIAISSSDMTEGTASTSLLTFTTGNWSVAQNVTVTGVDDFSNDGDVAFTILTAAASSTDANYNGLNAPDVSATNTDNDPASSAATAFWKQSGLNTPQYNEWDGLSFGIEGNSASVGEWRIIDGAEAPTRDEKILVGINSAGVISGEFWNGTTWTALPFALDTVSSSTNHAFDVVYEPTSGDALLVWNNGSGGSAPISYRVWNGTSWSAEQSISAPISGDARQIQLAGDPNSDEMILVVSTANKEEYALVWNGSTWASSQVLDSGSGGDDHTSVFIGYESQSGEAVAVYDTGSGTTLNYRTWSGSSWSGQASLAAPGGLDGAPRWTSLDSDPTSDRIAVSVLTPSNEIWLSVWDGSAWGSTITATTASATTTAQNVAVAFESSSGDLLATYGEVNNSVRYRTWTTGGGWSSELVGPNIGGTPSSMTLSANSNGNQIMLSVMETNSDIHFVHWNGSSWGSDNELESNSGESENQPFLFLFDNGASFDSTGNSLWLSSTGDKTNPGLPGVNSIDDGEVLRFSNPNLDLEPGTTSGTFSHLFNLDDLAADGNVELDGLHYVSRYLTIGSGANTLALQTGDVLVSTDDNETLGGVAVLDDEVVLFRPNIPGDYSSGTFTVVLDNFGAIHGGNDTWSLSLVEQNTTVGDVTLAAGTFLFSRDGGAEDNDIRLFTPTGVGAGGTAGTVSVLIEGDQINIGPKIYGLELVETDTTLGGVTLSAGTILVTLDADDSNTGDNNIATKKEDVFYLTVTQTTLGSGSAVANATLLFQGVDVGLAGAEEGLDALALFTSNQPPTISNLSGDSLAYSEGDGAVVIEQGTNAAVTDVDSADFDTGSLTISFTAGSDSAEDVLAVRNQGSGAGQIGVSGSNVTFGGTVIGSFSGGSGGANLIVTFNSNATASAAQALIRNITYQNTDTGNPTSGARTVRFVLTDGDGGTSSNHDTTVTVNPINDAPAITSNGGGATADITLAENTTSVTTVTSSDVDGGIPSYSLSGGVDAALFSMNGTTGELTFLANPDFEAPADSDTNNTYVVTVQVSDGNGGLASQTITVTITAVDEFNVGAISDTDAAADQVAENSANGTTVGLTAFADDADTPDSVSYSLDDDALGRFAIDSSSGVVTVADALDREAAASYDIVVRATSTDGSTSTQTLTITLTDIDEFDITAISDADAVLNFVDENAATGTIVGITASASDADATTNSISYSLDDDAGGRFAINGASGVVTVANGTLLDRESAVSHNIMVRATSADGSSSARAFTININDVDEFDVTAPADNNAVANTVTENAGNGTLVGITALASDDDATNNTVSYLLVDDAGGRFTIDSVSGVISVADGSLLDREAAASHAIIVRATSADGSTGDTSFTINVTDVDEFDVTAPADNDPTVNAVNENAANGTVVGIMMLASDADATNNTVSYSLVDDAGGRFAIDVASGEITVADGSLLDRETASSHSVTVRTTSTDGSTADSSLAISVNDVDEFDVTAPADNDAVANAVNENAANGTLVGITAVAGDSDATTNTVSYSLVDDAGGRFAIDAVSGIISVADGSLLDREASSSHAVTIRATSADGSTADNSLTISVNDVDEFDVAAPADNDATANTVNENATNGTTVGIAALASDADATTNSITYSLVDDAGGRFAIDGNSGVISVADGSLLDRENAASHAVTVRATSADGSTADTVFTINVADVDEFDVTVPADTDATVNAVDENAANGTTVGITALASDADATNNTVSYSLVDDAGGRFTVDGVSGVISVADGSLLDRQAAASHTVTVRATSVDGSTNDASFTINLNDLDQFDVTAPADIDATANAVNENAANGSTVGITAFASDADATNNVVSYSVVDDAGGRFSIDSLNGVISVADGSLLDRETAASHSVTVRATSVDGSTADTVFTININDVDEFDVTAPADNELAANAVNENAPNGTVIGITASATDADATNNTVSYSLLDDAGGRFAIDSVTGVVSVADGSLLDREAANLHAVMIRATSADGSTADSSFTINVNDVDEFDVTAPADNDATVNAVNENAANGTAVGITAVSSDADATTNTISYSLVDDAGGRFAIDGVMGTISVADGNLLDREAAASHIVTIRATSADGSTAETSLTINVNDVDEFDVTAPIDTDAAGNAVNENAANGTVVGVTTISTDADATTNSVNYSLVDNVGGRFAVDPVTGVITVADGSLLDREVSSSHTLTVRATSADGSTADTSFAINVNDVDEFDVTAPADNDATANAVNENAANGTVVGVTIVSSDADATTNTISYSLVDDAGGRFAIDGVTGTISVADGSLLDREASSSHAVTIRATSADGSTADNSLTISVNDVDEFDVAAPADNDATANTVNENATNGTAVGITAVASDADATTSSITYSLVDDASGRFTINATTGVISVADGSLLDRETAASHAVTVRATSDDGSMSDTVFTINVTDVDEFDVTVPVDTDAAVNAVNENAANGTTVGITTLASDADATNNTISYSLVDDAAGRFAIDSVSGVISLADGSLLDRESAASHIVTIRATSADGSMAETSLTINVNDVDEFDVTSPVDSDAVANVVNENAASGTAVGVTAQAADADATINAVSFSLVGDAGGRFTINSASGVITVADGSLLNREAAGSHTVTVRATSADGSSADSSFTINVNDVDEFDVTAPADINATANVVNENALIGTTVGITAFATDADATNNAVSYSLDDDAGGRFVINATTGVVTVGGAIDYETASAYNITIRATSSDASVNTLTVSIAITDLNDVPPTILPNQSFSIAENSATGTALGSAAVSDPDTIGTLQGWTILAGNVGNAFAIDSVTGQITVADGSQLDFETRPIYTLSVQLTDGAHLSAPQVIAIVVTNVNDAPIISFASGYATNEDTSLVFSAANGNAITISDADVAGGMLGVRLTATNGTLTLASTANLVFASGDGVADRNVIFAGTQADIANAINGLSFVPDTNYNGPADVQIQVRDMGNSGPGGELTDDAAIPISVQPVNDAPVANEDAFELGGFSTSTIDVDDVLQNDSDVEGDSLSVVILSPPGHGTVGFDADGNLQYTPNSTFMENDSFQYTVSDGQSVSNTVTVTVTLPIANAPVATSDPTSNESDESPAEPLLDPALVNSAFPAMPPWRQESQNQAGDVDTVDTAEKSVAVEVLQVAATNPIETGGFAETASWWQLGSPSRETTDALEAEELTAETPDSASRTSTPKFEFLSATNDWFWDEMDEQRDGNQRSLDGSAMTLGATVSVVSSFSVGYVFWILRGGSLLSSFLATMPAWRTLDPLTVLQTFQSEDEQAARANEESLSSLLKRQAQQVRPNEQPLPNPKVQHLASDK